MKHEGETIRQFGEKRMESGEDFFFKVGHFWTES